MFDFRIEDLLPAFLLADRNGYAMAKAVEAALKIMCSTVQTGLDIVKDVEQMPEWRLDEMAWEMGCLYDYTAPVEIKRRWIRDATPLCGALGTPQAVYSYLEGYFEEVELEEFWQYGGEPYHFRVTVSGLWDAKNEAWLRRAVEEAKNVRSICEDVAVGRSARLIFREERDAVVRVPYTLAAADGAMCGTGSAEVERRVTFEQLDGDTVLIHGTLIESVGDNAVRLTNAAFVNNNGLYFVVG